MKKTVVIKLYRPNFTCGEFHDVKLGEFDSEIKELKRFASAIGKEIYFTVCQNLDCAEFDCFAEIIHSGELSDEEKNRYISAVKFFARDAEIAGKQLKEYDLPLSILFRQADIFTL